MVPQLRSATSHSIVARARGQCAIPRISRLRSLAAMRERAEVAPLPAVSVLEVAEVLEVVALAAPAFLASGPGAQGPGQYGSCYESGY